MGALDAKLISSKDVIVADWVRVKCQYGCGGYGRTLTCPPYSPTVEQMRKVLSSYRTAMLLKLTNEEMCTHDMIAALERSFFLSGYYYAFGLPAGPCERCKNCTLDQCRHPRLIRPSMEACSVDVYATARKNGFSIDVRKSKEEKPAYFGLVLTE